MEIRLTMDLFENRYYKLIRASMMFCGLWPDQSIRARFVILIGIILVTGSHMLAQVMAIVENLDDRYLLIDTTASLLFCLFCFTKIFFSLYNSQKVLKLLNRMRADWQHWNQDCDVCILYEYAQTGRKMMVVYAILVYTTSTIYAIQPVIPKIIDVLLRNGTEPGEFPIPVEYYFIDMQKYYFYLILHCYVCTSLAFISSLTYDCLLMTFVQHGCGLFAVLGRKLQRIGKNERSVAMGEITHAFDKPDIDFENLRSCIDRHHEAIEYAELIETSYSWCFFIIMGTNMLLISITGLQTVKGTVGRQETTRFIISNILSMAHLYVNNYMAQILMDHSISIRYYIFNSEWYKLPMKTQKLLILMIMRCNVPCKLTAGKISTLSIETFSVILKTSLSYFTLLRSI